LSTIVLVIGVLAIRSLAKLIAGKLHPRAFPRPFQYAMPVSSPAATVGRAALSAPPSDATHSASEGSRRASFMRVFESLSSDVMADVDATCDLPPEARDYIARNISYNVPHGKLNRGMAVLECFRAFHADPAAHDEFLANTLGWCVEFLQAFFLVADDIMDDSVTRRGQPCFYRLPEIGLKAVNDALMLELMIYRILKRHLRDHTEYMAIVELFQEMTYITEMGQLLDLTCQKAEGVVDLEHFTAEALHRIYRYKTSHYSFYLPVALGMRLAGEQEESKYATAKRICLAMGEYFQAQDDFIDCFGDPALTGKIGTDIEDNTCTWLVVEALKTASVDDRAFLAENYAKKDPMKVKGVKELYRRLKVPEAFAAYEQTSYETIKGMIDEITDMPTGAFTFLLAKIYKRDK
jgi:farnesyl diphosphate synthase